jgi:hypothetical protein
LMWLIHIHQKGWLLLAQVLVAINHHHCSLQYNVKILTVAFSAMMVANILYHRRFSVFAIVVVALTINYKRLVIAWRDLAFSSHDEPYCAIPRHKKCYPCHRPWHYGGKYSLLNVAIC